ncbi:MAG: carbonic anhydrase family protein [Candidatus Eremiobacteraeota bacterium]|nr:carbonic anhydrase family protein [Candidatus Eremiobacteraeota bacterium]MBV8222422.1 carbonic anhydrase family protein [Candidatus Eremiobacteraeota bacterium]MBV8280485.1 carbonic anhydrase family protein [Candidatus Eremiobacteraeota bacterium]
MNRRALLGQLGAGMFACAACASLGIPRAKAADHGEIHWGYSGEAGPDHWGTLEPAFSMCSQGKLQSPIDLGQAIHAEFGDIELSYHETPLRILNNGHTVQINYEPGSTLALQGRTYQIVQFHFHTPSEHTANGKHYDMELHIVHQDDAKNLAVLGVFLKSGGTNAALDKIWSVLPLTETPEKTIAGVSVNAADLLPSKRSDFYQYLGSLTTPPCSEGVLWLVLAEPVSVSLNQVAKFKRAFPMDARPVQPLNQRFLFEET